MTEITLVSFGVKNGTPQHGMDKVIDCTTMPNPYGVAQLRKLSGLDAPVQEFVLKSKPFRGIMSAAWFFVQTAKPCSVLAFKCYGGRHRSVATAELVANSLRAAGVAVAVKHLSL